MLKLSVSTTLIIIASFAVSGCGEAVDPGPPRFPISGTVTLDGDSDLHGTLFFVPLDGGPGTSCMIEGGAFSSTDPGAVAGPQGVTVEIFDGPREEDGDHELKGTALVSSTIAEGGSSDISITLKAEDIKTEEQLEKEAQRRKILERRRERGEGQSDRSKI